MNAEGDQGDFEELMDRHLDGDLSLDEGQRLARLLVNDAANAERFARSAAMMHQQMRSLLECDRTPVSSVSSQGKVPLPLLIESSHANWPAGSPSSIFGGLGNLFKDAFSYLSLPLGLLLVAIAFISGGATVWWLSHRVP